MLVEQDRILWELTNTRFAVTPWATIPDIRLRDSVLSYLMANRPRWQNLPHTRTIS